MHTHVAEAGDCTLPILATYGVTQVRDLGGRLDDLKRLREAVLSERLVGPDMLISGPPVESQEWLDRVAKFLKRPWQEAVGERTPVSTPEDAAEQVRQLKKLEVDLIKFRNLGGDPYRALLAEAKKQGLPVAGHAPGGDAFARALAGKDEIGTAGKGMISVEHIETVSGKLGNADEQKRQTIFAAMQRNGTYLTPTLVVHESWRLGRDALKRNIDDDGTINPDVTPELRRFWKTQYDFGDWNPNFDWAKYLARVEDDARLAHGAGIEMLVGTDLGAQAVLPGSGVHAEMEAMVKVMRMTPAQALRAGTFNAAKAAGLGATLGEVKPGYKANLILLQGNPLLDISATRKISAVLLRGKMIDRKALGQIRARTHQTIRSGGRCVA
jgi:imidazolonepropionase-like amidohydrolase